MPYTLKYTTLQSLQNKANNRLKILNATGTSIFNSTSVATQPVDEELLLGVAEEEEAYLDSFLQYVYALPLQNQHPILRKCVDGLVIAELLELFYAYAGMENNQQGQNSLKTEAYRIIRGLTFGINLPIPLQDFGMTQPHNMNFDVTPIKLPGEVYRLDDTFENTIPTFRGTLVDVRTNPKEERDNNCFDVDPRRINPELFPFF